MYKMYHNIVNICFFVIIIDIAFLCCALSESTNVFVNVDDSLTLPCTVNNNTKASWEGPCLSMLNTTTCNTNTITYFDGLRRNRALPGIFSLDTYKEQTGYSYNLHIVKVSVENTGLYKCFRFEGAVVKERHFEIILKVKPSNPVIENMTSDSRMTGTEGVLLDLVCTVTSGIPLETMTWNTDQSIVAEGGPGTIQYLFIPTSESNGQTYYCIVNSDALETPLTRTVQLDIKYRPVMKCMDEAITVVEGNNFTVKCLTHSNPSPTLVIIRKQGSVIKQCSQSPCSKKIKSSRYDSGVYWCTAQNQIGDGNNCQTIVKTLYPPDVSVVFLNDTTLSCSATGVPNNATFLSWKHYNEQGEVRTYNGSKYLTICLSCKRYTVNGLYICSATNGIKDTNGNSESFGNVSVQLKGPPEILPKTKDIHYGKYRKSVLLKIFVYSITPITIERISRNDKEIESLGRIATNGSLRNEHKVTYHIAVSQKVDFTNYTFKVKNDQGATPFTVSLVAKDIPEAPVIKRLTVKYSDITVHFNDTFDGGLPQVYVLQYRSIINWTSIEVKDTFDGVGSYTLQNLEVGQKYHFRMYSFNTVGKSNFSGVWSIELTGDLTPHVLPYVIIAMGIVVLLFFTTVISRKVDAIKACLASSDNNGENDSVHDQQGQNVDVLVENQLYLAFDSRNQQQNANVNRPRYLAAQNHGENSVQNRNLHYADLEFNPASQRFVIRGDDRTIYSEIDHALVAPPLESSDSEEEDKKNEDEDDFMTVEEIAEFMRERGMKPPLDDD